MSELYQWHIVQPCAARAREDGRQRKDLESKTTLHKYRNKIRIEDEEIHSNLYGPVLMLQYITDCRKLGWPMDETINHLNLQYEGQRDIRLR